MKQLIFLPVLFYTSLIIACPFYITNDTDNPILVINPNGIQGVYIEPGKMKVIDPTISGKTWWKPWKYLRHEILNFYESSQEDPNNFILTYQMTEKYCLEDYKITNQLTLSEIKEFIKKPTDRLSTKRIEKQKTHNHNHKH